MATSTGYEGRGRLTALAVDVAIPSVLDKTPALKEAKTGKDRKDGQDHHGPRPLRRPRVLTVPNVTTA